MFELFAVGFLITLGVGFAAIICMVIVDLLRKLAEYKRW